MMRRSSRVCVQSLTLGRHREDLVFMSFPTSSIELALGLIVWIKSVQNDIVNLPGVRPKSHIG